ncbi:MAG: thermosome subunit alpha [Candidatus Woesearchaeota archaeon]
MTNNQNIQPVFILADNTQRTTGKNAQKTNIMAAKLVAETVRTTLGPKGMDKMIVDSIGDITITNDGVTILNEMQIEHPSAKMIVEIAKTQEAEIGDGTTTAVVIAGELLAKAEALLDQNIHPTVLSKGYRMASEKAQHILKEIAEPVTETNKEILKKIAMTAMTGKGAETAKEHLANLAVEAINRVLEKDGTKTIIDLNDIKIEKKTGGSVDDSELIDGIVLDKEKIHAGMPKIINNAKIALIDSALEIKNPEIDAKISITDPEKMQAFLDMEETMLKKMVDKIVAVGANVVFCQKGIDDMVQHFLAKKGIYAARRVKKSDMEKMAKATGANIVTNLDDISGNDLGKAGIVEEIKSSEDEAFTYVKKCKNPKSVTIMIKGGTEHVIDEVKRAMDDALGDIRAALTNNLVVGGAGAVEVELAKRLRKFSESLSGREQLAVGVFADAIEIIPKTLAENAGLDPIDVMTDLKAAHDKGEKWAGINVFTGKTMDSWKDGVIEPLRIKTQAISSASEVAIMILRIDDVIAGGGSSEGGMPKGAGGSSSSGGMPDY